MCSSRLVINYIRCRSNGGEEIEKERVALTNRFAADPAPPGPALQDDPAAETRAIFAAAKARLDSYGWNDAEKTSEQEMKASN